MHCVKFSKSTWLSRVRYETNSRTMSRFRFPDPRDSTEEGIVALGGDLSPETLLEAYRSGIFPWPISGRARPWGRTPTPARLRFENLHVSSSLRRQRRKASFEFTHDRAFDQVIRACAQMPRPGQDGTWITPRMLKAYIELHRAGHAHSVEAWRDGQLVGGIYGVDPGGAFAAESMFYIEPYASKLALLHLIEHLSSRGLGWLDIQVMTPHLQAMGAEEIDRDSFLELLERTLAKRLVLF